MFWCVIHSWRRAILVTSCVFNMPRAITTEKCDDYIVGFLILSYAEFQRISSTRLQKPGFVLNSRYVDNDEYVYITMKSAVENLKKPYKNR